MDSPPQRRYYTLSIKIFQLIFISYIVCLKGANATPSAATTVSSKKSFYKVTLYRDNYVLPYHFLEHVPKARPNTIGRTLPVFTNKIVKQRQQDQDPARRQQVPHSGLQPKGHRRNASSQDPRRRGMVLEEHQIPQMPPTPIMPGEYQKKKNALQRTRTLIQRREEALQRLQGAHNDAADDRHKEEIACQIDQELSDGVTEVVHELLQFLEYGSVSPVQSRPVEAAFQISLKIPLLYLESSNIRFYAAYTQQSWWQCYTGVSAFFRESNYMPEFFIEKPLHARSRYLPYIETLKLGVIHQSNGAGLFLERSWNRLFFEICIRWRAFYLTLEPWWALSTKDRLHYNPKITEYLGHWRARLQFEHRFFQCDFQLQQRSYQLIGKIPITPSLFLAFYHFNGKGSSLGLQDQDNSSWGIGLGAHL